MVAGSPMRPMRSTLLRRGCCLAALASLALAEGTTAASAPVGHFTVGTGAAANTVFDTKTRLTWQQGFSSGTYVWSDSLNVCAALSLNGSGWRQPTMAELVTLVDFRASAAPLIDTASFPNTPSALFWTSTPLTGSTTEAWAINFNNGNGNGTDTTSKGYVRCVR
jgi:hypothetical protein